MVDSRWSVTDVRSFLRSFVPSFVRSFVSFVRSFVPSFVPSFVRSFVPSFVRSFVPSFVPSFVRSCLCCRLADYPSLFGGSLVVVFGFCLVTRLGRWVVVLLMAFVFVWFVQCVRTSWLSLLSLRFLMQDGRYAADRLGVVLGNEPIIQVREDGRQL